MTAVQQQVTAAEQFAGLWKALMPDFESPSNQQFLEWAGIYSEQVVSRGISRAGAKARKMRMTAQPMNSDDVIRYAASVMRNESLGIRRHGSANSDERRTVGR